jgi:hypothetical protein
MVHHGPPKIMEVIVDLGHAIVASHWICHYGSPTHHYC